MDWACWSILQADMISHLNKYSVAPALMIIQCSVRMSNLWHQVKEGVQMCGEMSKNESCHSMMILMCNKNVNAPYLKSDLPLVGGGDWVNHSFVLFETWHVLALAWNRAELLSLLMSTHNYYQAFNVVVLKWCREAVNAWMAITLNHSIHSQRHYSVGWALACFKSFLHPSWFRATTVQFLHHSFAASSFTPSSQCNLGCFSPGSLMRTLLDKSSSWHMTCPAHLNQLNLQNFTMSFSPQNWYSKILRQCSSCLDSTHVSALYVSIGLINVL